VPLPADALRKLLQDFNVRTTAKMSAIVSRSGVPIAWVLPDDAQVDNFATMAATLLGALEVIYASMRAESPTQVTVESDGGLLSIREITGKMFLVSMADKRSPVAAKATDDLLKRAKGLLA
jgi:predicted regulator of Ras-like GTPase activity (Roadblock/LC7/MglB family)